MSSLSDWSPYQKYVQGGMKDGDFANGQFLLVCAGPPHMSNFKGPSSLGSKDVVFPIGLTQNVALSHNRAISRIFEIGSERSYFIPGRTVGQLTLSRVYYSGASLLRCLWAYYQEQDGEFPEIESLWDNDAHLDPALRPYAAGASILGGGAPVSKTLHRVRIPPGFNNVFLNLASDLFSQPIGIMLLLRDSDKQNLAACYLEQCYVPTHNWATDANGLIIQESVGIHFERLVPVNVRAVATIRGLQDGALGGEIGTAALGAIGASI